MGVIVANVPKNTALFVDAGMRTEHRKHVYGFRVCDSLSKLRACLENSPMPVLIECGTWPMNQIITARSMLQEHGFEFVMATFNPVSESTSNKNWMNAFRRQQSLRSHFHNALVKSSNYPRGLLESANGVLQQLAKLTAAKPIRAKRTHSVNETTADIAVIDSGRDVADADDLFNVLSSIADRQNAIRFKIHPTVAAKWMEALHALIRDKDIRLCAPNEFEFVNVENVYEAVS